MDLIKTKYLIYGITYEGISREETPQFPVEAIRESLMNAIAHKDYADATPTQISVYPDHIVFGMPDNYQTTGQLNDYSRNIRPVHIILLLQTRCSDAVI